jgi:hypothetical protein
MPQFYLKLFSVICLVALASSGCKKEAVSPSSPDMNYFPTQTGKWVEYSVDSIVHAENDNNNDDSVYSYHYYLREVVDHSFIDGEGQITQVIYRYKKDSLNHNWEIIGAWTEKLTAVGAFRTEDNVVFEKLAFPIRKNTEWNGNCMNTKDEQFYSYANLHQSLVLNNLTFDSTLSVVQFDDNNYIERRYGLEIFATGIGLVYKEDDQLEKRVGIVVEGTEYRKQIIAFGE